MAEERFRADAVRGQLIEAEHHARYRFAAAVVAGRRVLDAGCGAGWGSQIMLDHRAESVDGVDIDEFAVRESQRRCPRGTFVRADFTHLPYPDHRFEVITCFEAIEHVEDPLRGLTEFHRVLAPGGMLFVSSSNPDFYPAGNPFHIHEFRPPELLAAVSERFEHATLWRQHAFVASALHADAVPGTDPTAPDHRVALLADLRTARDIYGLVVGSDALLPAIPAMVALVSSRQLDDLGAAGEATAAERAAYIADHERIVEERTRLIAEHTAAYAESIRLAGEVTRLSEEVGHLEARATKHASDLARLTAERDRAWRRLLESEQDLARSADSGKQ